MRGMSFDQALKRLLIDSIDEDGGIATAEKKIKYCQDAFQSEYGWRALQIGTQHALGDWLQGLPTACTVPFTNHDIFVWGASVGAIREDASDDEISTFIDRYWKACPAKLLQLFNHHNVPSEV